MGSMVNGMMYGVNGLAWGGVTWDGVEVASASMARGRSNSVDL